MDNHNPEVLVVHETEWQMVNAKLLVETYLCQAKVLKKINFNGSFQETSHI